MIVMLEGSALARLELGDTCGIDQRYRLRRTGDRFNGLDEKGLELRSDPEHYVGVLQFSCLRRLHLVPVRGGRAVDQQFRLADTFHHRGNERVDRLDRRNDGRLGMCHRDGERRNGKCQSGQRGGERRAERGEGETHGVVLLLSCYKITLRNCITCAIGRRKREFSGPFHGPDGRHSNRSRAAFAG